MVVSPEELDKALEEKGKQMLGEIVEYVDARLREGYSHIGAVVIIDECKIPGQVGTHRLEDIFRTLYAPIGWEINRGSMDKKDEGPIDYFGFRKRGRAEQPKNQTPEEKALEIICRAE